VLKPTDGLLLELARQAGVRPTVIYHLYAYRKAMGTRFTVEGYAAFSGLPVAHANNALAVLPDEKPVARKQRATAARTQLPEAWDMPEDWLLIGRERRFWPMDVCRTEADKFANWHRMKGNAFADWKAAWRNWIDGSRREDGKADAQPEAVWDDERRRAYLEKLK
jgi:hypothetical protein